MRSKGFTLLEVMVALIVFVMMASLVMQVSTTTIGNQVYMENKVLASWLAENETVELRSVGWGEIKNKSKEVESANRKWAITHSVTEKKNFMGVPGLIVKEVAVSVALADQPNQTLQTYLSYMANEDA